MNIIVGSVNVSAYITQGGISESFAKIYDTSNAFTAADGTEYKKELGVRCAVSVSLENVPENVKNQLRTRSRYDSVTCTVGTETKQYTLDNYSASVIVQREELKLWKVSFTLTEKDIRSSSSAGVFYVIVEGLKLSFANNDFIGDIKLTCNAGGLPTSGVSASQLSFTVDISKYGWTAFGSNCAECTVGGFNAPKYYITGRSMNGDEYTITATDRTIFLDLPFDYTVLEAHVDSDGYVQTGQVVSEIARQAGFTSGSTGGALQKILYKDLATSCRSVLDIIASASCGTFYCSANNSLEFLQFGAISGTCSAPENQRTDVIKGMEKGPINGVLMINTSTNDGKTQQFSEGSTGSSFSAVKIQSKYATAELCNGVYQGVKGKKYTAFKVDKMVCSAFMSIGTLFSVDEFNSYNATNITMNLSRTGSYASIGTDINNETEWDFSGALTREVNAQIKAGHKYNGVSVSQQGGLVCEGAGGKITSSDGKVTYYTNEKPIANNEEEAKKLIDDEEEAKNKTKASASNSADDDKEKRFQFRDLGDGLYMRGNDIECMCKLLSRKEYNQTDKGYVMFEYEKYYIKVSYTRDSDGFKHNPTWERIYKSEKK